MLSVMSNPKRFQHPRFAKAFVDLSEEMDARGGLEHRRRLLAGVRGNAIEVGAGHGRNFAHYPPEVTGVLAVEPEDSLRRLAEQATVHASVPVRVVAGHADQLPAADGSMDAAVLSLVFCSVPDPDSALAELARVLKPGGVLHYYEHVRSTHPVRGLLEDAVTPLYSRFAGGCHLNRDTGGALRAAGFEILEEERFSFRPVRFSPSSLHVLGRAAAPAVTAA
jgi:ubiquinone/menaquinone biosynthesis C-methylase UbiE